MQDHLTNLNPKQREAVLHTEGPLLVVAGAGAGKTKTITHRIVHLIKQGISPEQILAVTFTNKAAKEMRERIMREIERHTSTLTRSDLVGGEVVQNSPFVSTFHSLGVHIIKENAKMLGLNKFFTILDEGGSLSILKEAIKESDVDPKQFDPKKIRGIISREKGKFVDLEKFEERLEAQGAQAGYIDQVVAQIWKKYEAKKKAEGSLDFDDLLIRATKLLHENEQVRKNYQNRWRYIHIDEYQDTNEVQYILSKLLAENHQNICVVGDVDQCIYGWRQADIKNILSFEKNFPKTKVVLLEQNYRSTQNIIEVANEIIKKNQFRPEKNLFTKNERGEKVGLYEAMNEKDEAEFIATKALEIIDGGENPNNIAVLYRTNFQSRILEEAMLNYSVPYQVLGVRFFERKEVKDMLAYLRASLNPESLSDIKRIINFPRRGIGKTTIAKIFAGEKEKLPLKTRIKINQFYELLESIKEKITDTKVSDLIKWVVKRTGVEEELLDGDQEDQERLENIKELATLALKYDELPGTLGLEKLLEDASLASDQDSLMISTDKKTEEKTGVKLMTIHASKGLEFKYVFITGLEDGLFPQNREGDSIQDKEEERRLFYVALTRAEKKIFLTFANTRTIFGSTQYNAPSEFLADVPPDLLEKEGEIGIKTIYI